MKVNDAGESSEDRRERDPDRGGNRDHIAKGDVVNTHVEGGEQRASSPVSGNATGVEDVVAINEEEEKEGEQLGVAGGVKADERASEQAEEGQTTDAKDLEDELTREVHAAANVGEEDDVKGGKVEGEEGKSTHTQPPLRSAADMSEEGAGPRETRHETGSNSGGETARRDEGVNAQENEGNSREVGGELNKIIPTPNPAIIADREVQAKEDHIEAPVEEGGEGVGSDGGDAIAAPPDEVGSVDDAEGVRVDVEAVADEVEPPAVTEVVAQEGKGVEESSAELGDDEAAAAAAPDENSDPDKGGAGDKSGRLSGSGVEAGKSENDAETGNVRTVHEDSDNELSSEGTEAVGEAAVDDTLPDESLAADTVLKSGDNDEGNDYSAGGEDCIKDFNPGMTEGGGGEEEGDDGGTGQGAASVAEAFFAAEGSSSSGGEDEKQDRKDKGTLSDVSGTAHQESAIVGEDGGDDAGNAEGINAYKDSSDDGAAKIKATDPPSPRLIASTASRRGDDSVGFSKTEPGVDAGKVGGAGLSEAAKAAVAAALANASATTGDGGGTKTGSRSSRSSRRREVDGAAPLESTISKFRRKKKGGSGSGSKDQRGRHNSGGDDGLGEGLEEGRGVEGGDIRPGKRSGKGEKSSKRRARKTTVSFEI